MRKLMFATAIAASVAAFGNTAITAINFEGYDPGVQVGNVPDEPDVSGNAANYFFYDGTSDDSVVKAYGADTIAAPNATARTAYFKGAESNSKYLELGTGDGTLWRSINTLNGDSTSFSLGNATNIENGIYLDTLVQFTAWEDDAPDVSADDKLAVWLSITNISDSVAETNLMVTAGYWTSASLASANFVLKGAVVDVGTWHRLTIKAVNDVVDPNSEYVEYYNFPVFEIWIDGVQVYAVNSSDNTVVEATMAPVFITALQNEGSISAATAEKFTSGKYFSSRIAGTSGTPNTLKGVGFQGTGAVDDIVWTTDDLFPQTPTVVDFTLTISGGANASVSYVIGDGTSQALSGNTVTVPDGATIVFTATPNNGYTYTGATLSDGWTLGNENDVITKSLTVTENGEVSVPSANEILPTYLNGADTTILSKYATWKALNSADTESNYERQFLLNVTAATVVAEDALKITKIEENIVDGVKTGWNITIGCAINDVELVGEAGSAIVCNGYLAVSYKNSLAANVDWTTENIPVSVVNADGTVTVTVNKANAKFMKVKLSTTAEPAAGK